MGLKLSMPTLIAATILRSHRSSTAFSAPKLHMFVHGLLVTEGEERCAGALLVACCHLVFLL